MQQENRKPLGDPHFLAFCSFFYDIYSCCQHNRFIATPIMTISSITKHPQKILPEVPILPKKKCFSPCLLSNEKPSPVYFMSVAMNNQTIRSQKGKCVLSLCPEGGSSLSEHECPRCVLYLLYLAHR
ncbi:hypothetical protein CEXT_618341 [Caerostris extrusa]|uniref:Uncharacterized protein n=1 Tax=Caerostris extrusa TaxID=172846 RepID=A0AAV4QGU0_CAEEX|nr:hypothetical protein CEXT_618341 [Caerostris extrusa]